MYVYQLSVDYGRKYPWFVNKRNKLHFWVSTVFNTILTELHTFQLNFHCKYITANMFRVCLHKLKDKPHYTKPQMQSIFSNRRHFLPQRRSSASILTSRRKCSDTLLDEKRRWQVGSSLGRVFSPPGRIPSALLYATQMNRTVRCHLSQLQKKPYLFSPSLCQTQGKKWRTKARYP